MLVDRANLSMHARWIALVIVASAVSLAWYFFLSDGQVLAGNSVPGLTFGIVGGAICVFEFLLWPRKAMRRWRIGKAQVWMRAHIWLGLLVVPLIVLHSGFRFGGLLSAALMVLFIATIASGIFGLLLQQALPRLMLKTVPAETIFSQIDSVSTLFATEAERFVLATCGVGLEDVSVAVAGDAQGGGRDVTIIGARRDPLKVLKVSAPAEPLAAAEPLRENFYQTIKPYLLGGSGSGSALRDREQSKRAFQALRAEVDEAAHSGIDALEECCEHRRQFDRQAKIQFWLHSWLSIHLPLSIALIMLLFVHVWYALKYM